MSIRASHILVDDEETAEKIFKELEENTIDFGEAAKKYSNCPSSKKGGDLGFFGKGKMVPAFEKVAFELDVDEVSEPVKTQFGWHIIKKTGEK